MATASKKPKAVAKDKPMTMQELKGVLSKKIKAFTKELKSEGAKCGIIIDVTVIVQETEDKS